MGDVMVIVLVRAGDIARKREAGKTGDGNVGGPADSELMHPTAPDRDASGVTKVVDPLRLEQTA